MLWLMTMGRRLNGVYAAFMLVAFMMGVAGALQADRPGGLSRCAPPASPAAARPPFVKRRPAMADLH